MFNEWLKYFLLFVLFTVNGFSQIFERSKTDTIHVKSNFYQFTHEALLVDSIYSIKNTESGYLLTDYKFQTSNQSIYFNSDSIFNRSIIITYSYLPFKRGRFQKNIPVVKKEEAQEKKIIIEPKLTVKNFADEIFTRDVERSGSIVRGFSVGSNKDFSLNSALRLQMAGKLSEDVEVVAVLSDQSSPIQPEGNTRTLQEIDNVFIELKHKNAQATLGDFQWNYRWGTFNSIDRKLQGLKINGLINRDNFATVSYATLRGKFKSQQFNGQDGVQGPYRLTGENNERDIIVIAGTEKVFINGEQKVRGENYDYTIDYSTGEIFFTPKVVITSNSRIKVDFEYSDRKFERNFFGVVTESNLVSEKFKIGFSYFREGDDKDSPIDFVLDESDRKILESSGNDKFLATKSGIRFVGIDSIGRALGSYRIRDTLINQSIVQFYEFAPGDDSAFYNITFSFVGEGKGDYRRIGVGRFKFVGTNNGDYLPVIFLPLPELKQVGTLNTFIRLSRNFYVNGEYSITSFDKNRFSKLDENLNKGKAYTLTLGLDSLPINILGIEAGNFSMNFTERKVDSTYSSIGRIFDVEYERDWNLTSLNVSGEEKFRNLSFGLLRKSSKINLAFGNLKKGNSFNSNKTELIAEDEVIKHGIFSYRFSNLSSSTSKINSKWNRHLFSFLFSNKNFKPLIKLEYENKKDHIVDSDSLLNSSFRFVETNLGLSSTYLKPLDISTSFSFRYDEFPLRNKLTNESNSLIYYVSIKTRSISNFNTSIDLSYRQKNYYNEFKSLGRLNNNSVALKILTRGNLLRRFFNYDLFYEASSQRSARLEKIFVRVQKGNGNYIYRGDLNQNGIADEFEFEQTRFEGDYIILTYPTDELFPVTDLKASARFKFIFSNLYNIKYLGQILKPISLETYLRVEETSKDENTSNIYFIRLKKFQDPNLTLKGSNIIQQDINFFEFNPDFNGMLRFIERRGLTVFNLSSEQRYYQEQILRIRYRPLRDFANQTEINRQKNYLSSIGYRNFRIYSINFNSKIFYYPSSSIEVAFKIELGKSLDKFPLTPIEVNQNSQQLSFNFIYAREGRISFEIERTELIINRTNEYMPFELLRGYLPGKNYLWRLVGEYRFSNNLQSNLIYDGRIQGKGNPVHTAQAEIRAYF